MKNLDAVTQRRMWGFLTYSADYDPRSLSSRWPISGAGIPEECTTLADDDLNVVSMTAYDAVVALGLGLSGQCASNKRQLFQNIVGSTFNGASGYVAFDSQGDRLYLPEILKNVYAIDPLGARRRVLTLHGEVSMWAEPIVNRTSNEIIYPGGSTQQPRDLVASGRSQVDLRALWIALGAVGGTLILLVVSVVGWNCYKRAQRAMLAERQLYEDNLQRVVNCAAKLSELQFTVCFVRYDRFLGHGRLIAHEEARRRGDLEMFDDFDELLTFVRTNTTIFISQ